MAGARAVRKLIDARSDLSIDVLVVWIPVLSSDDLKAARSDAELFSGTRVRQFWDAKRSLGIDIASSVSVEPSPIAWDIYLFYDPGALFGHRAPTPLEWVHQLYGAAPGRYRGGRIDSGLKDLADQLFPPARSP